MKRLFCQFAMCTALGVVITIAVAWGCALWVDENAVRFASGYGLFSHETWWFKLQRRPGAVRIEAEAWPLKKIELALARINKASGVNEGPARLMERLRAREAAIEGQLPEWSWIRSYPAHLADPWPGGHYTQDARGWPMPALYSRINEYSLRTHQSARLPLYGAREIDATHFEWQGRAYELPTGDGCVAHRRPETL